MPPPKPPLTAVSEPDPIYPYLPFLFWASRWQRLCQFTLVPKRPTEFPSFASKTENRINHPAPTGPIYSYVSYTFSTTISAQAHYYRSLLGCLVLNLLVRALRETGNEPIDVGGSVVKVGRYPQSVSTWGGNNIFFRKLFVDRDWT
jgi:hypothetical protein